MLRRAGTTPGNSTAMCSNALSKLRNCGRRDRRIYLLILFSYFFNFLIIHT
jgi:hypothetical protein